MATPLCLPTSLSSVGAARRHVRTVLEGRGVGAGGGGPGDDAVLMTSELVANAVLHGGPEITLTAGWREGVLRVEVSDRSPTIPVMLPDSSVTSSGRGIVLVDRLADRWGVEPRGVAGKTVWFELFVG